MENISRRAFVGTAAGIGVASVAAQLCSTALANEPSATDGAKEGMAALSNGKTYTFYEPKSSGVCFEEEPVTDDQLSETVECDVVVLGAGISGLTASLSAADAGLKVILLEKNPFYNTRGSEIGCIKGKFVESQGGVFDEHAYYITALNDAHYRCNPSVSKAWIENNGVAVDWLLDVLGDAVHPYLNLGPNGESTNDLDGVTSFRGQVRFEEKMTGVGDAMYNEGVNRGVDYRLGTAGVQLVTDENGAVIGAIGKDEDGDYVKVLASRGVVLCTGGYENNWELLQKYCATQDIVAACWRMPLITNTGDGMLMAQAIGAGIDDFPHVLMRDPGGSIKTHDMNRAMSLPWPRVNEAGERFVNESIAVNYLANSTAAQPGAHDWALWCAPGELVDLVNQVPYTTSSGSIAKYEPEAVAEELVACSDKYDTLEDLAASTGIDLEGLKVTIAKLQESYEKGEDLQWGANPGYLMDWTTGPYYAAEEANAPMATGSGLTINEKSQVLTPGHTAIPGLYAVGNCSGSMFADTYPHELNGVSHGRCVTFGYMVGQRLAGNVD